MQKGDDAQEGTPLLERGTKLRAQEIGLLAALGITEVPVIRRPRVSILSTGDELVSPEQTPRPGQIRDVNTLALSAMLRPVADVSTFGIAPDRLGPLTASLKAALAGENGLSADVVFLSGGSSIGVRDLTLEALQSLGDTEILCHGVALSPGKPVDIGPLRPDTRLGASRTGSLRAGRHARSGGSLSPPPCRAFPHGPVFWAGEFPIRTRFRSDILAFAPGHTVAQHRFPTRTRRLYPREVGTSGERPSARRPGPRPCRGSFGRCWIRKGWCAFPHG